MKKDTQQFWRHGEEAAITRKLTKLLLGPLTLLFFIGCATRSDRLQSCWDEMQRHGVGASLLGKVQHGEALDIDDVVQLAQKAVPDPVTIDYVKLTRAAYTLSPQDLDRLRANKVSDEVIHFLLSTHSFVPPNQALN